MGMILGLILFGIPSAIVATKKGFATFRWLFAFGLIGLIVVACLPSARAQGITSSEAVMRTDKADSVGAWMCGINIAILALLIGLSFIHNSP
jgi:hypothetical protein